MTLTYPPATKDKQYGAVFPWIDERGVPTREQMAEVIESHRALQSSDSTSESLAQPVGLEFGALDVWVKKGGLRSWAYDDGPFPNDDYLKRQPLKAVREFCFAPGVDDQATGVDAMAIGFRVHGKPNLKSAKLELFCRGHATPIWSKTWGAAWERKDAEIAELPGAPTGDFEWTGEVPWSAITVDTALQIDGAAAFPDGLLTAVRSPYQLRLVVSGKKGPDDPPDGDRYAYPLIAWTYVHVLLHSIVIEAGDPKWLGTDRPDLHDDFRERVVGKRDQKQDGSIDYGLEGEVLEEIKQRFVEKADLKPVHLAGTMVKKTGQTADFYTYYERKWGKGPRIPLVATPKLRTCAGAPTDTNVTKVCKGLKLLWDWADDPVGETPRWKRATDATETAHRGGAAKTNEYLARVYAQCEQFQPAGSFNCPVVAGGKLGDAASPVLHEQTPKGDGNGTLPFEVTRCTTRSWAVVSTLDDAGKTGVVFQPSRFPGDVYHVRAYPFFEPAMDSHDPIDPTKVMHGYAGRFEVFRRVDLLHLVVGTIGGLDISEMSRTYRARARRQLNIDLKGSAVQVDPVTYKTVMTEAIKRLRESVKGHKGVDYFPVTADQCVQVTGPGAQFMTIRTPAETATRFKQWVVAGRMRLGKIACYPTHDADGEKRQIRTRERLLCAATGAEIYQLHQLPGPDGKDAHTVLVTEAGKPLAGDGDSVKGEATQATFALQLEAAKSCQRRHYSDSPSTDKDVIKVTFPGVEPVELKYKKNRMSFTLSPDLTEEHKTKLRDGLKAAVFDEGAVLTIVVRARQDSKNSIARVTNVKAFLDRLFDVERLVLDRDSFAEAAMNTIELYKTLRTYRLLFYRFTTFGQPFVEAYLDEKQLSPQTVVILHSARASNLSSMPDAATLGGTGTNPAVLKETASGGSVPDYRKDELDSGYIQLLTPDPADPATDNTSPQKSAPSIVMHEVGHGLFIPEHAPKLVGSTWRNDDGAIPAVHVTEDHCVMSYDKDTHQFCGLCMLRLRGWRYERFDQSGARVVKASIGFGDWDAPFADAEAVSTDLGVLAKLQALNLFNRPLGMRDDDTLGRKAQFVECADFSKKHAKAVTKKGLELPSVMREELPRFVCDSTDPKGEAFPTGTSRKLRLFSGFHLLYANSDIELRCREEGDELFKDGHPEEDYGLEVQGGRDAIQAEYFADNPGLGAVPLAVRVLDAFDRGIEGVKVVVTLVAPGPAETYAEGFAGAPVCGGTSFNKTTGAPAPHAHAKEFFDTFVDALEPSADDCPIKHNAHYKLGGKREMVAGGDVTSPGPKGERNLFVPMPGQGPSFPRPKDARGSDLPWSVELTTDDKGEAQLLFCPAPIGGDRYRFSVAVKDPLAPDRDLATYESGDVVVWRTVRVSRHLQMPNVAQPKDLPSSLRGYLETNGVDLTRAARALDPLDVKHLARELARGYVDCIVEQAALAPEPFKKEHWDDFLATFAEHERDFSNVVNCSTWVNEKRRFEVALKPDPTNKKRVFRGTFPAAVVPDTLYLTSGEPDMVNQANPLSAFAHSYDVDPSDTGIAPLVKLNANDPVCGNDKERKGGAVIDIDVDPTKSYVDLRSGLVQVTFVADQTGPFKAGAHLRGIFDVSKLLTFPDKSPFFFSVRAPSDYNKAIKGQGRVEIPDVAGKTLVETCIRQKPFGLTQGAMLQALHHSIGGNKQSYYPGLVIMHAQHLDPYTLCFDSGLEGKGIGNGVVVFNYLSNDPQKTLKLLVHEASHCLYFVHSHQGPRKDPVLHMGRHHMAKAQCVMNYDEPKVDNNNGGYCGKCLASLRGMPVGSGELKDKGN